MQISACNVPPSPLTAQEHDRPRDFFDMTHPTHGTPAGPDITHRFQIVSRIKHGIHVPRRNTVDSNTVNGPFGRQIVRKVSHAGFADVVCGLGLRVVCRVGRDGGGEEDGTACLGGDHMLCRGLGAEKRTRQIDVDDFAELGRGHGERVHTADDTGETA